MLKKLYIFLFVLLIQQMHGMENKSLPKITRICKLSVRSKKPNINIARKETSIIYEEQQKPTILRTEIPQQNGEKLIKDQTVLVTEKSYQIHSQLDTGINITAAKIAGSPFYYGNRRLSANKFILQDITHHYNTEEAKRAYKISKKAFTRCIALEEAKKNKHFKRHAQRHIKK